jgi:F0F1-type ATP synthase delta subunit
MEALRAVVHARRDHHKRAGIIRAYRARVRETTKTHTLHITCARELSPEELAPITHAFTESFRSSVVTVSVNPELVGGVQLTLDDQYLIDFSARGIIDRIFP